ncbi:hypothetical protein D9758_007528 [Tetrapyrgos nigripes]|uniref:Protein kinase domain-containing protein n=1 Tax=Tetrapyrgos nigripes TaxID=182062 RepID=A0A8H5G3D0_9AGAR|nr:hypothetical protein D9758_007528 [Tetrapyrgos nigripes]
MSSQSIKNLTGVSIMNGHFNLQNLLGSGAFGTVYCAVRTTGKGAGKEKFAVKVMPRPEEKSMKKWLLDEELRLQATVGGHKNVVAVKEVSYEVLKGESYACIRMDFCGLGDFFHATREGLFEDEDDVRSAFLQIIEGVQHCHQRGVFHRDLKPENVLCSKEGKDIRVRIADFGLATDQRVCYEAHGVYGTLKYMPPERICNLKAENKAYSPEQQDVWAIAYMLATACNGDYPWRAAFPVDPHFKAFFADPEVLGKRLPLVHVELVKVLQCALHPDPRCRLTLQQLREQVEKIPLFKKEKRGFFAKLFSVSG